MFFQFKIKKTHFITNIIEINYNDKIKHQLYNPNGFEMFSFIFLTYYQSDLSESLSRIEDFFLSFFFLDRIT